MTENREIPAGWKLVKLEEVVDEFVRGPFGGSLKKECFVPNGYKVYEQKNAIYQSTKLGEYFINENKYQELMRFEVKPADFIVSCSGTIGKLFMIPEKSPRGIINQALLIIRINRAFLLDKFFMYLFTSSVFQRLIISDAKGTAMLNLAGVKDMKLVPVLLPPIPEQRAIVAKIEELFSSLDKGIESLKTAQQQLKVYRQAVLKWAFEGKLTEEWRKQQKDLPTATQLLEQIKAEHEKQAKTTGQKPKTFASITEAKLSELPHLPKEWCWVRFGEVISSFKRGPFGSAIKKEFFVPDGYKVYEQKNAIYRSEKLGQYYINGKKFKELSAFEVFAGDYIVSCSGTIGKLFRLPDNSPKGVINQALLRIRIYDSIMLHQYFLNIFESRGFQQKIIDDAKGSAMQNLAGVKEMALVPFPICSLEEQHAIVAEIESRLSVCDKIEESIEHSVKQSEALRQSILKKAFEGKLVPQDPNDEPASVLLDRIKAEREKNKPEIPSLWQGGKTKKKKAKS